MVNYWVRVFVWLAKFIFWSVTDEGLSKSATAPTGRTAADREAEAGILTNALSM